MGSPKPALAIHDRSYSRTSREDCFPALNWYPQQSAWIREPRTPNNAAYNYPLPLRIHGPLRKEVMRRSLEEVVRRHEVLRSIFHIEENRIVQTVCQSQAFSFAEFNLTTMNLHEAELRARQLASEDAVRPFDLTSDALLRAAMIQLASDDYLVLLTTHHAVCDEWSAAILLHDLSAIYSAFASGKSSTLPPVSCSYGCFARQFWRKSEAGKLDPQVQFWMDRLADVGDFHHLTPDRSRPSFPKYAGGHKASLFPVELMESIKALGVRERVSPFMVYLAAFQCLLADYSGEKDIGVATCTANRNSTEVEQVIGPFSNRVILRTDFSGNPSFRELFARVRKVALDAYSHQEVPFGELVSRIAPLPASGKNPLFQVLLIMRGEPAEKWESPGLLVRPFPLDAGTTRYDLNVWLHPKDGIGLEVDLQYDTSLFKSSTMRGILESYFGVLELMIKNPDACINDFPISRADRTRPESSAEPSGDPSSQPTDEIEKRLLEIWEEIFAIRPLSPQSDYFSLGGDSVRALRLFARIEEAFEVKLPVSTLLEAPTVVELARILRRQRSQANWSSLVAVQPTGIRPPVFCIHSHTGDVFYCRHLARFLNPSQPIYGIQSQALSGMPPHFSVEEMAIHYVQEMRSAQTEGPYYLFGYSFGGMVAFEMALRLRALGQRVSFLGMFNTPAPSSLDGWPLGQFSYLRKRTIIEFEKFRALKGRGKAAHLIRNATNFSRMVLRSLKADALRLGARFLRNETAERLGARVLNLEHINIVAAKKYIPGSSFPGAITFFLTPGMPYLYSVAPQDGWRPYVEQGVAIKNVSAEGGEALKAAFATALNAELDACHDR